VTQSPSRTEILGEFLISLSEAMIVDAESTLKDVIRNRMDLVFLVHDVLHAAKFHSASASTFISFIKGYAQELVSLAAACLYNKGTKYEQTLKAIVKFWQANEIFETDDINAVIESARSSLQMAQGDIPAEEKRTDTLPNWFGDRNASWAHLPASYTIATTLKYGQKNNDPERSQPRYERRTHSRAKDFHHYKDLERIRARDFFGKKPSLKVRNLLDEYFAKVDSDPRPTADTVLKEGAQGRWTDAMGQTVIDSGITNSRQQATNGYGWSFDLCKRIEEHGFVETDPDVWDLGGVSPDNDEEMRDYEDRHPRSPNRRRSLSSGSEDSRLRRRSRGRSLSRSSYGSRDGRSLSRRNERGVRHAERRPSHERPRTYDSSSSRGPSQYSGPPSQYARGFSASTYNQESPYVSMAQAPNPGAPGFQIPPPFPGHMELPIFTPPTFPGAPIPGMTPPLNFGFPNNAYVQMGGNGYPVQFGNNNNLQGPNISYGNPNQGGYQGNHFNSRGGYHGNDQREGGRGSGW
jgi:hypothetical protein